MPLILGVVALAFSFSSSKSTWEAGASSFAASFATSFAFRLPLAFSAFLALLAPVLLIVLFEFILLLVVIIELLSLMCLLLGHRALAVVVPTAAAARALHAGRLLASAFALPFLDLPSPL